MWQWRKTQKQQFLQELQALRQELGEIKQLFLAQNAEPEEQNNLIPFPLQAVKNKDLCSDLEQFEEKENNKSDWSVADYTHRNKKKHN